MKESAMVESADSHSDPDSEAVSLDIGSVPVDVRFEAGRLLTRYDKLSQIQPGFVYELGHTLGERSIEITANGVLIARGELVNIGDQLGVRITALYRRPGDLR